MDTETRKTDRPHFLDLGCARTTELYDSLPAETGEEDFPTLMAIEAHKAGTATHSHECFVNRQPH